MSRGYGQSVGLFLLGCGVLWMLWDARVRRTAQAERASHVQAVVGLLGTADLALSSASRWLRHPSVSEPGAAFADAPAVLDADPAGAAIGPPRCRLAAAARAVPPPSAQPTPP